ncbi:MAG: amidophosphoribosyltransferase, partial [Gemmatimonadetes bacterium]|nr:amidophosphoribosyltransferase [Gemmatimonadota bacterium]
MSRRLDVVSGTSPSGPRDASPPSLDDKPREECGVMAVSGIEGAAELAFLGLYALQHRGQEAAGMVAFDDEANARVHKGLGLVADVFDSE